MTATVTRIHGNPDQHDDQVLYSAAVVTGDAGITYRQLDHWTRAGYLKAVGDGHGHGRHRGWAEAEVCIAALMQHLIVAGLRPDVAAKAARAWVESGTEIRVGIFTLAFDDKAI